MRSPPSTQAEPKRAAEDVRPAPSSIPLRTLLIALLIAIVGVRYHTSSILHGLGASPELPLATLFILTALHPLLSRLLRLERERAGCVRGSRSGPSCRLRRKARAMMLQSSGTDSA